MLVPGTFALTLLLSALTAIGPLTTDMYLPSLPDIAQKLSASTAEVQLTISAYLIGFAVGQIVYGPVSDRHGRKPVLIGAMAIYFVATMLCAMAPTIDLLIAARLLQAVGGSGGIVLSRAVVRDLFSGNRAGREMSVIGAVMALAPVAAPVIGGIMQSAFGWRGIFVTQTFAGAALVAVVWFLLPETLKLRAAERISVASIWASYRIVARNPVYLAYLAMSSTIYAGLFAWLSGAAFVLQGLYGLTPFQFGFVFAIGSSGFLIGSFIAARLVGKIGLDGVLGVGGCCATVGGLGMVASVAIGSASSLSIVLPVSIYLAGLGMVLPQSIAGALTPFPERAGAASSLFGFVQQTLAAISGAGVGLLLGHDAWPLAAAVAFFGAATLGIWIATRDLRKRNAALHHH
jgi:DHA1 family bicyclomycin/chloramphenicol resistance-like MFS transporter